ncbi:uncharacterized protein LOC123215358 isoform X2 [Mangifera indica]|uniref:uncharacterized protein LOC123215358 isoform X2 n=1 Tax=Mangifera indica TaxID=29780 RepID=UPI001CFC211B|nr:uncharacterized protein LOC123215358 isoform X2 [Mangifera indica]
MAESDHPRLILKNFLSTEECRELEFIHTSCSTVGYRPNVFSTTLSHLIATNSSHLIMAFVPIRERLKEKLEEFFDCAYELVVEFTGLISWTRGASIGWHSDDNRPYLKQRDFTDGEPKTFAPTAGDVLMYTADSRNTHSVDEVTDGERLTLTLWFSRDSSHDEDAKLISILSQQNSLHSSDNVFDMCIPLPASSNMYWFASDQSSNQELGFNICWARMLVLGYSIYFSQDMDSSSDISELMMEPLQLARGDELFYKEFTNILHALQVVQFFNWKALETQTSKVKLRAGKVLQLSQSQREKISGLNSTFLKGNLCASSVFYHVSIDEDGEHSFDWAKFSAAIMAWEGYIYELHKEILVSLPFWRTHQSIFSIPFDGS